MLGVGADGPLGPLHGVVNETAAGPPRSSGARPARRQALVGERAALAILVSVDGLGPMTLGRFLTVAGSAQVVVDIAGTQDGSRALAALARTAAWDGPALEAGLPARIVAAAAARDRILSGIAAADLHVLTLADRAYPPRLRAIGLPPHVLFVRGDPASLSTNRAVAIVGTRRPTPHGRELAGRIGRSLIRAGACVVSGLAVGIDGAAHAAALEQGGPTVAVIGSGHARLYPARHGRLADAIVESGGAVVSELAPEVGATKGTFPRRNRLISGLSEATIVVEAPARSGALTTAAWALEQGRGCYLVPGGLDAPMSAGCLAFLREAGAEARIVTGIPQLLDDLELSGAAGLSSARSRPPGSFRAATPSRAAVLSGLDATPRRIAEALLAGAATVDELVAVTDLPVAAVLGALTRLETADLVSGAYGRYALIGDLAA